MNILCIYYLSLIFWLQITEIQNDELPTYEEPFIKFL